MMASYRALGLFRRIILLITLAYLLSRIIAIGVSAHYAEAAAEGDLHAARQALNWEPRRADAAYRVGVEGIIDDPVESRRLLARAYIDNPTDPLPLLVLGGLAQADGDQKKADELIRSAGKLRPVNPHLQQDIARYWLDRGQFDLALQHWSIALQANPRLSGKAVFTTFRGMLEHPDGVAAFQRMALKPPSWWDGFFQDTAQRADDLETLRLLYRMRRQSNSVPVTLAERQVYVDRLLKDGFYTEAYLTWVNGLSPIERRELGLLFNGSFELPVGSRGFDWHVANNDRVDIARARLEAGDRFALRLVFRLSRAHFNHLMQPLFLAPGAYEVRVAMRSGDLQTESGLRWIIGCRSPDTGVLGESERFLGSEDWTRFSFQLKIPETCEYQEIRLISAGPPGAEEPINGEIWIDDISIRRIDELSPLDRAAAEIRRLEGTPNPVD